MRGGKFLVFAAVLAVSGQGLDPKAPGSGRTPFGWGGLTPPFDRNLDATVSLNGGQTLLFKGDQYALYNRSRGHFTTGAIKSLPGWPKGWEQVNAAARWTDSRVVLFNAGSYVLYDLDKRRLSQPGDVAGWPGWPSGWADGIDAALEGSDATLYLFRGSQYITLDKANGVVSGGPMSVRDWKGWPSHWIDGIDSADNPGDGYVYFFRGSEVLAYDLKKARFVKGYPKQLAGTPAAADTAQSWPPLDQNVADRAKRPLEWRGLPAPFNAGIGAAVSVDKDRVLLFKDDKYVVYFHKRDSKGKEMARVESSGSLFSMLPEGWAKVHAAAKWNDSSIVLFQEGKYVRYDLQQRKMGQEHNLSEIAGWPAAWPDGIDAALADDDGDTLYLFRGSAYISFSKSQQAVLTDPSLISDWTGLPGDWLDGIDGADNPGDGRSYLFRDGQVLAWDNAAGRFLDGYPKDLPDAPKKSAVLWPPVPKAPKAAGAENALLKFEGLAPVLKGNIDAGASIGGDNVVLFSGSQYFIYNSKSGAVSKPADLSTTKGWPANWTKVDAAASWDDVTLLLFSGGEFIQYNTRAQTFRGSAEPVSDIPNWPAGWTDGINAACNLEDDTLYLFHGSAYVTMAKSNALVITAPQSAKAWDGWPTTWITGPTGTVEGTDGRVYFFRGSEYLPYDPNKNTFVAKAPQQLPGTMPELVVAAWPPIAVPPAQPPDRQGRAAVPAISLSMRTATCVSRLWSP